jgi:glucokinase
MADLFAAANAGDAEARRAVEETATLIGIAVANVAAVLDPSLIVLGGSIMAQGGPLVAAVGKVVERLARAPVALAVSALGKDAPLCGCLLMAATEARKQVRLRLDEERVAK